MMQLPRRQVIFMLVAVRTWNLTSEHHTRRRENLKSHKYNYSTFTVQWRMLAKAELLSGIY